MADVCSYLAGRQPPDQHPGDGNGDGGGVGEGGGKGVSGARYSITNTQKRTHGGFSISS